MTAIDPKIEPSWKALLQEEFNSDYFKSIVSDLKKEKQNGQVIYPPGPQIFNAFQLCPVDTVKVVIVGQDPYHGPGQAHGLCFSVPKGIAAPPSLVNILKELKSDLNIASPEHGNLESWAQQGVLLLNSSLTVRQHEAGSHFSLGWHLFTDAVIRKISAHHNPIIFLLWGKPAQTKKNLIQNTERHYVLEAPHPSPLSAHRGFLGCRHFSKTNAILQKHGLPPINWAI